MPENLLVISSFCNKLNPDESDSCIVNPLLTLSYWTEHPNIQKFHVCATIHLIVVRSQQRNIVHGQTNFPETDTPHVELLFPSLCKLAIVPAIYLPGYVVIMLP
jgi:hypothetical protein